MRWQVIVRQHACETDPAGASWLDGEEGRQGGWRSCAPEWRLLSAAVVGPRTRDTAKAVGAAARAHTATFEP